MRKRDHTETLGVNPILLAVHAVLYSIFKPPTVSSPVGYVGKETLRKRDNIYCYLRNGHFITVNQFVTTTVEY